MKEIEERQQKLEWFKAQGINPYAYRFEQKQHAEEITSSFSKFNNKKVKVAGRLMAIRGHGKASFSDLVDATGKIQLFFSLSDTGEKQFAIFRHLDRGDIVGIDGTVFKTKAGETTIKVKTVELLSKCVQPLPDTWFGVKDVELRYRQRYLDMIMNREVRKVFEVRSKLLTAFREFLDQNGFWEVETPVLQPIYGGAHAKPFVTHHNALDFDFFLRISDELYLKRLIIGGFEGVYEVSRDFRNEGIDRTHNPEFTQIEFYKSYWDYNNMMDFVEKLFRHMAKKSVGKTVIEFQGHKIDLGKKWTRITLRDAIKKYLKVDIDTIKTDAEALKIAKKLGIEDATTRPFIIDEMIKLIRKEIIQPTFLMDYPIELCPLTKPKRGNPKLAEIFQPIIAGMEMGRAFSELNDPADQRKRFEAQQKEKEAGAEETQPTDEDFIIAQEYGMPPLGGVGISIDRPSMLFTNMPCIRDVLAFPAMRPEE